MTGCQIVVATSGEVFSCGTFVELVKSDYPLRPNLLKWSRDEQVIGPSVEHGGVRYEPRPISASILPRLTLPSTVGIFKGDRDLLTNLSGLIDDFIRLAPRYCSLVGRFVLTTWIIEVNGIAPTLLIEGPDFERANQLVDLLCCLCRRPLQMSVTHSSFCRLPSGMRITSVIRVPRVYAKLAGVLQAATYRNAPMLRGGELCDLFGAQVILSKEVADRDRPGAAFHIVCSPTSKTVPALDSGTRQRIAEEFQPKLLAYRFARHAEANNSNFDCSKFARPLWSLASCLAAATPNEPELQAELYSLLEEENDEIKSANWIDLDTVIVESLWGLCREAKKESVYMSEIAEWAQTILKGRGQIETVDPGVVGKRLKALGFAKEPRDSDGVKLRLSTAVSARVDELANQLDAPTVQSLM